MQLSRREYSPTFHEVKFYTHFMGVKLELDGTVTTTYKKLIYQI